MGLSAGLIGPTLLKFGEQTNSSLYQTGYLLTTRSVGFLAGTIIGGGLVDRFPSFGRTFITIAIAAMCAATCVLPLIYSLVIMAIVHFCLSFAGGIVDNLAQILTMQHYEGSNVNPYLQALHGAFGVGALLSPLTIGPFLQKDQPADQWHYAYWIIGLLHFPNVLWMMFYVVRDEWCVKKAGELDLEKKNAVAENQRLNDVLASNAKPTGQETLSTRYMILLGLITAFIFMYVGSETAFGSYLHTYASLHLRFEKDIAAYLSSAFWASFAFGRLCGIPLSLRFSPSQMISFDLIGSMGSLALLLVLNRSVDVLWVCSILFGLSAASIYASTIAYAESHITITGTRMSILAVGGSAGDAIIPLMIGYSINSPSIGSIGFVYISFAVVVSSAILYAFIVLFARRPQSKAKDSPEHATAVADV